MAMYQVEAEALYFNAQETGVSYAIVDERVVNPNFNKRLGARVGIGIELGEESWELGLQFLHYHARVTDRKRGDLYPCWGHPLHLNGETFDQAENLWRLHLGFLDATLSKGWSISSCLHLTPFTGLRYAEVRHKLKTDYQGTISEKLCFKNKFWGVGPGVGLEGIWRILDYVGIYSRGAFHLVYGQFYIHQDMNGIKLFNSFFQTQGMFETAAGLDMKWNQLHARIGWELHLLLGQNQLVRFVDDVTVGKFFSHLGDLSMQGLTLSLSLEF